MVPGPGRGVGPGLDWTRRPLWSLAPASARQERGRNARNLGCVLCAPPAACALVGQWIRRTDRLTHAPFVSTPRATANAATAAEEKGAQPASAVITSLVLPSTTMSGVESLVRARVCSDRLPRGLPLCPSRVSHNLPTCTHPRRCPTWRAAPARARTPPASPSTVRAHRWVREGWVGRRHGRVLLAEPSTQPVLAPHLI